MEANREIPAESAFKDVHNKVLLEVLEYLDAKALKQASEVCAK